MDRDHAPAASSSKSCYDLTPPDTSAPSPHELFRSPGAELFLVDTGDERLPIRSGDFALLLVKSSASPLAAVMAMVGEVQWPVGSDCIVRKEGDASFVFSLPGPLEYLLFLGAETVSATDLRRVEDLLEEYAAYAAPRLQFQPAGDRTSGLDAGTQQASKLTQWLPRSGGSGISSEAEGPVMGIGGALSRKRSGDADTRGRIQRARRLSAVAKLFSKILERGAINMSIHVEPMLMDVPADQHPTPASSLAMAGADAVIRVVDAVETGGRTLLESVGSVVMEKYKKSSATRSCMVDKPALLHSGWTLNKLGLLMLFRMIGASMAAHSSGSTSSRLSRSSSSSGICRLLSSSSSSSSFSSKSPTKASQPSPGELAAETPSVQPRSTVTTTSFPPPPPLFTSATPLVRHSSTMPPPSGPPPAPAASTSQDSSSSFRLYKPRASPATTTTSAPCPPPPLPRPPRFQPPARK